MASLGAKCEFEVTTCTECWEHYILIRVVNGDLPIPIFSFSLNDNVAESKISQELAKCILIALVWQCKSKAQRTMDVIFKTKLIDGNWRCVSRIGWAENLKREGFS